MKILSIKASVYTLMIIAVILAQASAQDIDYANLYSKKTLKQAYRTYAANLRGVWEEDLLGRLTVREKRAAANIKLNLPLVGFNRHPFDFYADPVSRQVTIPILSIKFFDEIAIAMAWMERNNCDKLAISDYVGMIRYQNPGRLPHGFFPPPLQVFGVPGNVLDDPYVNDVSGKALKSAIYFLMAHELAHVVYQHKGYRSINALKAQEQEMEADAFALNVMRRISVAPLGMSIFFMIASRFELAPGDFDTLGEYENYLRGQATHPLTSSRLITIAQYIRNNVDPFTRGQTDPGRWRPRILALSNDIEQIGRTLDDRGIRELQRYRSRTESFSSLAGICR